MLFVLEIIFSLVFLVVAAEILTNGFEHIGKQLRISEGVTGSLLAAVATALPESMIPIIAILGPDNSESKDAIGIGAIIGAPLMLSTLAIFLISIAAITKRGVRGTVNPEYSGNKRDLLFFIGAYMFVALTLYIPSKSFHYVIAGSLVLIYVFYVVATIKASKDLVSSGHGTTAESPLLLSRVTSLPTNLLSTSVQLCIGMVFMIFAAKVFIHGVEELSYVINVPALLLSLLIVPIATELPEKINSIIWIRNGKDTLAFGNINGAMVFQGTLLPAFGMVFTSWLPDPIVIIAVSISLIASFWLLAIMRKGGVAVSFLFVNGILYIGYFIYIINSMM